MFNSNSIPLSLSIIIDHPNLYKLPGFFILFFMRLFLSGTSEILLQQYSADIPYHISG